MKLKSILFSIALFSGSFVIFLTNGCHGVYLDESQAASQIKEDKIRIGIHSDIRTQSLDYDLLSSFIKTYNLYFELVNYDSYKALEKDFANHQIDLSVTRTSLRHSNLDALMGPAYDDLQLSLFCQNHDIKKILIPAQYENLVEDLQEDKIFKTSEVVIVDQSFSEILDEAYQQKNVCFLAESKKSRQIALAHKRFFKVWNAKETYPLAWFSQSDKEDLNKLVQIWFQKLVRDNKMISYRDQHDAPQFQMSLIEYRKFKDDIKTKLPVWKKHFEKYAHQYDVPWTLIAAVAYQESKWNNDATSHTGVKGFMQLTKKTAAHLGVDDRENPLQSIQGGSYYLKYLYDKTPNQRSTFERWVQALAAYNVGWAHLRDVHRLARTKDVDAYRWKNLKELLPELSNEENLSVFQFGLARGDETVDFVESVLSYYEVLNSIFTQRLLTSRDF